MSDPRIGTSGWSYPTGAGTWNGLFYPKRGKTRPKGFDELTYYAERFDTVEINSSFYGTPTPETTRGWVARTPPGFAFSLKLYQKFTHPKMFREAALKRAPGGEGTMLELLAEVNQADIDEFKRAMDPLASAGKLGALLAQFPPSFKADAPSQDYLHRLLRVFREYPVAVELRHKSWSDEMTATSKLLNASSAAWVQIDEPKFQTSIRQNFLPNVTGFYYLRLHGRNAQNWWHPAKSEDRYDYLYSAEELDPFAEIAGAVKALVKKMYLYTNNHFASKAVVNALMLKERLGMDTPGDYPEDFVERYPQMRDVVKVAGASAGAGAASEGVAVGSGVAVKKTRGAAVRKAAARALFGPDAKDQGAKDQDD
jgi:uncharacterized protein YecE (DUF72 family)